MAAGTARRIVGRALVVLLVLLALLVGGVAWYFAGQFTAVPTVRPFEPDNVVREVDPAAATLELDDEGFAAQDATWGLQLPDDRHVVLGETVDADDGRVGRTWSDLTRQPPPRAGEPARVDEYVWVGTPAAVGLDHEDVEVGGPLGPLPSWWVPARRDPVGTVVFVHGRGATREEALRFLPALTEAGWNVLVQTYRGDEGAPDWPDGRVRYGTTEWADVRAAVDHVTERRPDDPVVLFGVSMGGSLVAQYLDNAADRSPVAGVVLDSPVLSLDALLRLQARLNGIPDVAAPLLLPVVEALADLRVDLGSDALEQTDDDGTFDVPTLVFHGSADGFVPAEPSRRLAAADDDVRHVDVSDAGHVRSWNLDRELYETTVVQFLEGLAP